MPRVPEFTESQLDAICGVLGDTDTGLKGSEIGRLLARCGIEDPSPKLTKRYRLCEALSRRQAQDRCGNNVVAFIMQVMTPVVWIDRREAFESIRERLNGPLAFSGLAVGEDGLLRQVSVARTIDEAEERASRLRAELRKRGVHPDVLRFCRAELLQQNYFHVVLEATKSVADKVRQRTGLMSDASKLIDEAFGLGQTGTPLLAFNSLRSDTERSEHVGLANLLKGMFGAFRNVAAHAPKIYWPIDEQDAMDLLAIASLLHRRLDAAIPVPRVP